jgi:membrane protein DedA with SNARE-associated domain
MDQWLLAQSGVWIYITLFFLLMGGAIGLPIPEDLPLLLAGILLHEGRAELDIVFVVAYAAILLGDLLIYSAGRKIGPSISKRSWLRVSESQMRRIKYKLDKRSLLMIFVARHLFYLRTLTFLSCGALKMNIWRFLIADAAAALISVPLVLALGYFAAEHYDYLVEILKRAKVWSFVIVLLLLVGYLIYLKRRKKAPVEDETEL